jgi:hypothetical protein
LKVADAALRLFPIGQSESNLAIAQPAIRPAQPIVGQAATVTAQVANYGDQPATVAVRMHVEGRTYEAPLRIAARGAAEARFDWTPTKVGTVPIAFSLDGGGRGLTLDKSTGVFAAVVTSRRVLLVTDRSIDDPTTGAYFVARALAPDPAGAIELRICRPGQLATRIVEDNPEFVVLVEAGGLTGGGVTALRADIAGGGAGLWVVDSEAAAAAVKEAGPIAGVTDGTWHADLRRGVDAARFDGPVLGVFEGASRGLLLRQTFRGGLVCKAAVSASVLISFADGCPLLVTQSSGLGRLAMLAAALNPQAATIVREPVFLPLLHQLVRELGGGPSEVRRVHPGEAAVIALDKSVPPDRLRVEGPGHAPIAWRAQAEGQRTLIRIAPVENVGAYTVLDARSGQVLGGTYVEVDPSESDLTTLTKTSADTAQLASGGGMAAAPTARELWPLLAVLAVVLIATEQLLVWLWPSENGTRQIAAKLIGVAEGA